MRNRETLGNQTFSDVTAWRGIRHADRVNSQKVDAPEEPNLKSQTPSRKSQLHQELTRLNMLEANGYFTTRQERMQFISLRRQFRAELQELDQQQKH